MTPASSHMPCGPPLSTPSATASLLVVALLLQALDSEAIARLQDKLQGVTAAYRQLERDAAAEVQELQKQLQGERQRHGAELERQRGEQGAAYSGWLQAEREVAAVREGQAQVGAIPVGLVCFVP
jgi:hypothetical protein